MDLKAALAAGTLHGITEIPESHIETWMSDVFIYTDKVRKVFKKVNDPLFGDLLDLGRRRTYYQNDFNWNKQFSPEIHIALKGVRQNQNGIELCAVPDGEDFFIEMHRINDNDTLIRRLQDGNVTKEDLQVLIKNQVEGERTLTKKYLGSYEDLVQIGLYTLNDMRLDDLRNLGKLQKTTIPEADTDKRMDTLQEFFKSHKYFKKIPDSNATVTIDNHSGNVVFVAGVPHFIDVYLPKREWRVIDRNNNIARIAACVRTLGGNDLADSMYEVYHTYYEPAPKEIYDYYEIYNAYIKAYYYIILKRPKLAERYFTFADINLEKIKVRSAHIT